MGSSDLIMCLILLAMSFRCRCLYADEAPIEGFINIDCGAPKDTFDTWKRLSYKSDNDMIRSGMNQQLSSEFRERFQPQYSTLRSFPNGTRNCYHVKLDSEGACQNCSRGYLIRAYFVYGNYDGLNMAPTFDLYVGVNLWTTEKFNITYSEIVTLIEPSIDYMDVCLVNTNNEVPYISSLELRPFNISLYGINPIHTQNVIVFQRRNIGGSKQIMYPEDVYDRQWDVLGCDSFDNNTSLLQTNASISETNDNDNPYKLPQSMLQTACQAPNSTFPLEYSSWTPSNKGTLQYYFCFHFVEIEKLKPGLFREMKIVFNDVNIITNSIKLLQYLKPYTLCSKGYQLLTNEKIKLSISATSSSTLPPILNGIEIFYTTDAPNLLTFSQDVNAMRDIKEHYKLSRNWEGDPCQPLDFSWDGLNCSNNNGNNPPWPRITSLNLSNSSLTGDISSSISNLTAINYLDLSNNELKGVIPESLALLPQLQFLNLSGNKLTGMVPDALLQKYKDGTLDLSVEGNQELCWSPPCNHHKKKLPFSIPILCTIIVAPFLVILLGVAIVIYTRKSKENSIELKEGGSLKMKNRPYKYSEVLSITDNFGVVIGEGGFGKVYLGALKDQTKVAVKVLSQSSQQGYKEFRAEAQLLMVVHHRNLVTLLGYCDEGNHKALIYEYMPNGNLKQYLSGINNSTLSWVERLQIAVDVSHGLEYLHNGCKPPVIHRDLKPSNILLDKAMQAKIADFGLSRTLASDNQSQLLTHLAGTPGYLDLGAQRYGNVNKHNDVYSLGIILLELVTGQPPLVRSSQGDFHILKWVETMMKTGDIKNIVDVKLGGQFNQNSAWKIIELGMSCTQPSAVQRPDMSHVLAELKQCLEVHKNTSIQTPILPTVILSDSEICPSPR